MRLIAEYVTTVLQIFNTPTSVFFGGVWRLQISRAFGGRERNANTEFCVVADTGRFGRFDRVSHIAETGGITSPAPPVNDARERAVATPQPPS